jgi:Ca-activated chloride channel family protein
VKNPNLLKILLPSLLIGLFVPTFSQTADDAYHAASAFYVAGKIQEASVEAEEGLRIAPDDIKLGALAELLRKLKDQQRGNQGQGDNKQDKNKDKKDDKSGDKNQEKEKNREGQNGDQKKDKPEDKKKSGNGSDDQNGKDQKPRDEGGPPKPEAMSEADAKRLLNSFADDEKKEQAERRKVIPARSGTEQDW